MYKTKDFYLVSTLVLFGYQIKRHINENNKSVFFFDDSDGLSSPVSDINKNCKSTDVQLTSKSLWGKTKCIKKIMKRKLIEN
jgi:hemerythrin-like domain-containing protein